MEFAASQIAALASIVGDYGAALVVAGVVTYVAMAYFEFIGQKTIYRVNAVRPDIERLKRDFEGKPNELNHALLGLYTEKGINGFGFLIGLVPLVLLTLLIVAFTLSISGEVGETYSALVPWINNLGTPDPWHVLPVVLGLIYLVQSSLTLRFNPSHGNTSKLYLTRGLPAFALLVSAILPAGATIYWVTYAGLSVTQQYFVFQHALSRGTSA